MVLSFEKSLVFFFPQIIEKKTFVCGGCLVPTMRAVEVARCGSEVFPQRVKGSHALVRECGSVFYLLTLSIRALIR